MSRMVHLSAYGAAMLAAPVIRAEPESIEIPQSTTPLRIQTPRKRKTSGKKFVRATGPQSYDEWKRQLAAERAKRRITEQRLAVATGPQVTITVHAQEEVFDSTTGQVLTKDDPGSWF